MRLELTRTFTDDYAGLSADLQRRTDKAPALLLDNRKHPSLQVKKMKGYENRWELRVSLHYRLTFTLEGDVYVLLRVGTHDLLK